MTGPPPRLSAHGLTKRFGDFVALDDVSLHVPPGTVHALLGENGAGKSTLVKCIMGYHHPDSGTVQLGETEIRPRNPRDVQALGIGMVYQHFTLVPNMTAAENLVLGRPTLPFVLNWPKENAALESFMARMPFQIPLHAPVRSLAAGEKQKLEILKQLYLGSRIMILDEPTSVLTPAEADEVLGLLRDMVKGGDLSVVIITHKFREVTSFADDVTVLRKGRHVGGGSVKDFSPAALAELMVGSKPPTTIKRLRTQVVGEPVLRVDTLSADDDLGVPALRGVSFDVCQGEIVGIAAVAGNGQEELVEVLGGQRPRTSGRLVVHREDYTSTRDEIRQHGLRCLPEDPLRSACVPTMTVVENLAFHDFDRPSHTVARYGISRRRQRETGQKQIANYGVRTPSADTPIGNLSGGNVQRVVLARELSTKAEVLIAANPCMGLDFLAVSEIHDRIRSARDQGTAVLLVSADLDELFALADRILVMSEGQIVHETPVQTADLQIIGQHMAGHA